MRTNKKIILTAVLLALLIILSRFLSLKTPYMKISFAFVPTMLCAVWLGPKWTILLNVLGDVIGATLFPTGPYFVGYTISTAIAGLIYGLLLYKKEGKEYSNINFLIRLIIATTLVAIICNMGLNTLWSAITTGKAFWGMECYLKDHHIENADVLFLHTGGAPLFYDYLIDEEKMTC